MFIYSLPILFSQMQWGTPTELLVIVLFLTIVLYIATPFGTSVCNHEWGRMFSLSVYQYLLHGWLGHLKLWVVFWPFFIILNCSLYLTDTLAKQGNFTVSSWDEIHFILLTPIIFWTILVWRNSIHTSIVCSAAVARLMTLFIFFEYGLKLLIRKDYPRIFFSCQDILLDYGVCF